VRRLDKSVQVFQLLTTTVCDRVEAARAAVAAAQPLSRAAAAAAAMSQLGQGVWSYAAVVCEVVLTLKDLCLASEDFMDNGIALQLWDALMVDPPCGEDQLAATQVRVRGGRGVVWRGVAARVSREACSFRELGALATSAGARCAGSWRLQLPPRVLPTSPPLSQPPAHTTHAARTQNFWVLGIRGARPSRNEQFVAEDTQLTLLQHHLTKLDPQLVQPSTAALVWITFEEVNLSGDVNAIEYLPNATSPVLRDAKKAVGELRAVPRCAVACCAVL
jgi:hypothetical protein